MADKSPKQRRVRTPAAAPQPRAGAPAPPADAEIPRFCEFACPFAEFPPPETAGICRTMSAVWCGKLRELVNKNAPCEWRARGAAGR